MEILCKERLAKCLKMAREHDDDSLHKLIHRLLDWEIAGLMNDCPKTICLGSDFEENSFSFSEQYDDGRTGICGGILFHGYDDQPDNSCAVCVDGPARGWRMHT